jgi:hypothetical protein
MMQQFVQFAKPICLKISREGFFFDHSGLPSLDFRHPRLRKRNITMAEFWTYHVGIDTHQRDITDMLVECLSGLT